MALTEQVQLDISQAQRQISSLESQLTELSQPINVPVDINDADIRNVAQALGISEDRARELAGEVRESVTASSRLDSELREVARSLGLSEKEAGDFVRQMRRAEGAADDTADATLRLGTRGASVFTNLKGSLLGVVAGFGAIEAARGLFRFFGDAITATSDLEESTSKAQVVFGEFFSDIQSFAATAPQALGLANAQALEFSGTFGNLFTALGLSQQAAAELAPEIVQLGADLASFNNLEVTEALDKLRAGLVGEAEPLRTLGVNLTAAATAAKAVELGLAASTSEVSEAAKVQARYALILEQTTTAQGDFERTSEGLANQQRSLAATFEELQSVVGTALVPALQAAIGIFLEFAPSLTSAATGFATLTGSLTESEAALINWSNITGQALGSAALLAGGIGEVVEDFRELELGGRARNIEELERQLNDLVDAWGGNSSEIRNLIDNFDFLVETFNLTGREAALLRGILDEALVGASLTQDIETENTRLLNLADRLRNVGTAAREAAPGFEALIPNFAELNAQAARATDFGPLEEALGNLPDLLSEVRDALRDEEGEIVDDFGEFAANLNEQLAAQLEFDALLDQLSDLGFEKLEEFFRGAGIESLGALADGFTDPAALADAEAALDRAARDLARAEAEAFGEEVARFVAGFDPIEMPADLEFNQSQQDLQSEASFLFGTINLPVTLTAAALNIPDQFFNVNVGAGAPGGGSTVTVNQTFTEPTTPSTETTRAAQSVNSLVNVAGPQ